ncbi:MAG: signal peptidase I [Quadrisphaera sp.]
MSARQRLAAVTATLAVVVAAAVVLPVLLGQMRLVVTHGVSMQPLYHQGDLVAVWREDRYRVGDIIAFDHDGTDASKTRVLHRVISASDEGFVTQGDNNPNPDPGVTHPDRVLGRAVLHLPGAGLWVQRAGSPWGIALLVGVPLLLSMGGGAAATVSRGSTRARRARARRAGQLLAPATRPQLRAGAHATPSGSERWGSRAGPPTRSSTAVPTPSANPVALGVVLVLGAAGLGLGVSSWTTPPDTTTTQPAADLVRTATFSYAADVRRSPVYDGSVVTSPTPVFRAVATSVHADLAYRGADGEAGSIDLTAHLSSPGGWTTTVPVATGLRYSRGSADLREPLDLDAFLARSAAAAAITKLDPQPLAVTLTATITPAGADHAADPTAGGPLVATMPLTVSDAQVGLSSADAELVATAKVPQTRTVTSPGAVSVVGMELPVQPVRVAAVVLIVLAVLGGLVLALVTALARSRAARADARSTETERAAACLADLLVPVVDIPGADSAVEVISPEALERLARAHELPVLHRRGHGAAVFAVVVEGTTYTWSEHDGEVVSDEGFLLDHVLHHADGAGPMPWDEPYGASPSSSPSAATARPDAPEHWSTPDPQAAPAPLSPRRAARAALAAQREPDPDEPTFAELLQPDAFSRLVDPDPFARLGPAARGPARRARSGDGAGRRTDQHGSTRRELPPGPSHARR